MDTLNSIWRIERLIWGVSMKRKIRNKRSRFYKNIPKFGVAGSALLLVGSLWMRIALFFSVICLITAIPFGRGTITPRAIELFGLAFLFLGSFRMRVASKMLKKSL
jgi:hypothetical protein